MRPEGCGRPAPRPTLRYRPAAPPPHPPSPTPSPHPNHLQLLSLAACPRRLNPIISQVNRFKGCLCVAIFKLLLALRLNGVLPNLPIRVVCLPYYFAAILRCVLHFAKAPPEP